ncbi:MAG: amidohydrolase family protein [Clostridia bacterium]|nr:amidohydrolase family protein [Clostridia bacterium]
MPLFEVKQVDKDFYENNLKDFLPDKMVDIHCHVWLDKFKKERFSPNCVSWPSLVAVDNSIEDLLETYRLMFPDKKVTPLIFSSVGRYDDFKASNEYVKESSQKYNVPALLYSRPWESAEELEKELLEGGFLGVKSYLANAPKYIPDDEIRIFDFFPPEHLKVLDKYKMIMMCHIPRSGRLKDPVNLAQLLEIEEKYPNIKLIMAHIGRAYSPEDIGDGFKVLSQTKNLMIDFCANTLQLAMEGALDCVGPQRVLFGSDMPILRMRMRRISENGRYINLIAKGAYGDVSGDSHMREVDKELSDTFTFFMYEEIAAFKRAAESRKLTKKDVEDVFYNNGKKIIDETKKNLLQYK